MAGDVEMKLVHDADRVAAIPIGNLSDIADMARRFADAVDAGEYGSVLTAFVLIDTPENMFTETWGDELSVYKSIGMLEFAKRAIFDD